MRMIFQVPYTSDHIYHYYSHATGPKVLFLFKLLNVAYSGSNNGHYFVKGKGESFHQKVEYIMEMKRIKRREKKKILDTIRIDSTKKIELLLPI